MSLQEPWEALSRFLSAGRHFEIKAALQWLAMKCGKKRIDVAHVQTPRSISVMALLIMQLMHLIAARSYFRCQASGYWLEVCLNVPPLNYLRKFALALHEL